MSKLFNWIILTSLVLLALAMLSVRGDLPIASQNAQASPTRDDTTRLCQAVIDRLGLAQAIVADEMQSGNINPVAALAECLSQQRQADASACPEDFQAAEMRFVAAEDSLLCHAQAASIEDGDAAARQAFEILTRPSEYKRPEQLPAELKCDLDNLQSSRLALIQIALSYGIR